MIGYDLGGAVAVGFAAKYPNLCLCLSLLGPLGLKFKGLDGEKMLNTSYIGEYLMSKKKTALQEMQEEEFNDTKTDSAHRYLIDKQTAMVRWQIRHTPGYLGAVLSTYRHFPIRGMEELFTAIGRHPRKVLIIWGDHDGVCNYRKCIKLMEESFPKGNILDVLDCGHAVVFEKFEEVVRELLSFNKEAFSSASN